MLKWALVLSVVAACDKGPIQEHRIHYEVGGLGATGGHVASRIDVDLDKRTLVVKVETTSERTLDAVQVKAIAALAGCVRDETAIDPRVSDMYTQLVLEGDQVKTIRLSGPMTSPCAAKLVQELGTLAGWHD